MSRSEPPAAIFESSMITKVERKNKGREKRREEKRREKREERRGEKRRRLENEARLRMK
ncbi:MAG: hypothetical protein Q8P67_03255 [archaeon]|nr:hypothetical protein [archaeon]